MKAKDSNEAQSISLALADSEDKVLYAAAAAPPPPPPPPSLVTKLFLIQGASYLKNLEPRLHVPNWFKLNRIKPRLHARA